MKLRLLYFASLRERVGTAEETLDVPDGVTTVAQLRNWLAERSPLWAEAFAEQRSVRAAVDQTMAADHHTVHDGAEVAFFPPVTGG